MRHFLASLALLGLATAAPTLVAAAGQVEVRFKPVEQLTDVGRGSLDGERAVQTLADHFKSLAARLPDGRTLTVQVTDVNLAGELKPARRGGEIRVLKGSADWPTMDLQWSLTGDGRTLASGDDRLADMAYLMNPLRGGRDTPLGYETRMIDRWFDERFGPGSAK